MASYGEVYEVTAIKRHLFLHSAFSYDLPPCTLIFPSPSQLSAWKPGVISINANKNILVVPKKEFDVVIFRVSSLPIIPFSAISSELRAYIFYVQ
jgi:hypothetical protein